ncbi:TonB-dependent receptor [Gilvimarinus sp. F26214L]|uniref:TonB-dependent receptor n=1 Tax=Gilvimarinus sp. DZF01 TaxID=3461371 RepID=UPI0040460AE8
MKTKTIAVLTCAGSALTLSPVAFAQDQTESRGILEEIVVTTERRDQSLQEVPLSITAFGDEKRDLVGIMTIQDMADFAPGVSYNTSTDSPSIRGIARQSNVYTLDSPVANYVDGVYTGTVQDAGRRPIFVQRTEILRGPQGALAGRGSIAGAVNTILKRPEDQFGMEFRSYGGNYSAYGVEGTITGPLADWMRARLNVGSYHQDEGYFDNVSTGKSEGTQLNEREIADLMFELDLGENVDWYLRTAWADYVETRHSSQSLAPYAAGVQNAPTPWGPTSSTIVPIAGWGYFDPSAVRVGASPQNPARADVWEFSNDYLSTQELIDDYNNYTSDLTWHGPGFDLRWIYGNQDYTYSQWEDDDGTDVLQMSLPPFGRVVSPGGVDQYIEDRHWSSNEITLASTTEGPWQWVVGLFESREETRQEPLTTTYAGYDELAAPAMSLDALLSLLGAPHNPQGVRMSVPANAPGQAVFGRIDADTVSRAVFGQVEYQFNDAWQFTVGLRYNEDEKEAREASRIVANNLGEDLGPLLAGGLGAFLLTGTPAPLAVDVTPVYDPNAPLPDGVVRDYGIDPVTGRRVRDLENTWEATTGSVGVDYTPDDNTLIFGRLAVGYRPGGFNAGYINDIPQVDEETVTSYEIGYKATLLDQLQLSTTAFYYDFEDSQQELPTLGRCTDPNDLSSCSILNSFINLPESESLGLEVELNWAATDQLGVYLTYGYLDASVKDGLPEGTAGFSNPDDPAAVLPGADRYQPVPGQVDTGYTFLPRYTQDISGNQLSNSPKHRAALNLNYSFDLPAGSLTLSGNYIWRDESYSDLFENDLAIIPDYGTVGLRALWTDTANRYTVILYGSNLTDEEAPYNAGLVRQSTGLASAAAPSAAGQAHYQTVSLAPPRQYGIEFQYRFGGN